MRTVILGGSGLIGSALAKSLLDKGRLVTVVSRTPTAEATAFTGDDSLRRDLRQALEAGKLALTGYEDLAASFEGAHAVVNLAGANLGEGRWTRERKRVIVESRVKTGERVMQALEATSHKPAVLVQGSAVGYYGHSGEEPVDEEAAPGRGFLAETAVKWEASTAGAEELGVRRAVARTGMVLSLEGGALPQFVTPMNFFAGGVLGSGRQWISWIHLEDEVGAIEFLMDGDDLRGPFNCTAPEPEMNRDFVRALGRVMKRPAWLPAPAFALRTLFGEMAEELILSGQRVLPDRLMSSGYRFKHPRLQPALETLLA